MFTTAEVAALPVRSPRRTRPASTLFTLARRRALLTSRRPRQLIVPLVGPALFALVVAPLICFFAGLRVIVDRHAGAQRDLLAAPVPRAYLVLGNLLVALGLAALQVTVLIGLTALRGGQFRITAAGVAWFAATAVLFTTFMYALAETIASRVTKAEDYVGALPAIAVLPYFFAGALFPISAMPAPLSRSCATGSSIRQAMACTTSGAWATSRPRPGSASWSSPCSPRH